MKLVIWQPNLTPHQFDSFQSIAHKQVFQLESHVIELDEPIRMKQGWPSVTNASFPILKINGFLIFYFYKNIFKAKDCIHIFSGAFGSYKLIFLMHLCAMFGISFFVITESFSDSAIPYFERRITLVHCIKKILRPIFYEINIKLIKKNIYGVFAISELAAHQWAKFGISTHKIMKYGYFVRKTNCELGGCNQKKNFDGGGLRIIFIGSLIYTKGLDILISSVENLLAQGISISLDIYGPGDIADFKISQQKIRYMSVIPFGRSQEIISEYDLLVLPSRYDGWGVVLNEAINAGIPIICSNNVGAKVLVETYNIGLVFESNSVSSLMESLLKIYGNQVLYSEYKNNIIKAQVDIDPDIVADIFIDCVSRLSKFNVNC